MHIEQTMVVCQRADPGIDMGGCCNPLHIRWGTYAQNRYDQVVKKEHKAKGVHVGRVNKEASPIKSPTVVLAFPTRVTRSQARLVNPP